MPIFLNDEKSILFVHIPKCAGTSLGRVFAGSGFKRFFHDAGMHDNKRAFRLMRCSPQHYHRDVLKSVLDIHKFDYIFQIVRNPVSRMVSEYVMRNKNVPEFRRLSFCEWVESVFSRYNSNEYILDNHIRPQVEFILPEGDTYYYEQGFKEIVISLSPQVGGLNVAMSGSVHLNHRSSDQLSPQDVRVCTASLEMICQFYRADFEALGYDVPRAHPDLSL